VLGAPFQFLATFGIFTFPGIAQQFVSDACTRRQDNVTSQEIMRAALGFQNTKHQVRSKSVAIQMPFNVPCNGTLGISYISLLGAALSVSVHISVMGNQYGQCTTFGRSQLGKGYARVFVTPKQCHVPMTFGSSVP
jgi:hypothetical protein